MAYRMLMAAAAWVSVAVAAGGAVLKPLAHVEVRGTGPVAMVLIPGYLFDWTVWSDFMDRNKDRYTMYAVTLPGFGGSDPPDRQPDEQMIPWMDSATESIARLIDERGLKDAVVMGHSLGGHIALRLGFEWQDKVAKVVTVDGLPAYMIGSTPLSPGQRALAVNRELAPKFRSVTEDQWREQLGAMVSGMVTRRDDVARLTEVAGKTSRHAAVEYYLELVKSDITPWLFKLKRPALAIASAPNPNEQTAETVQKIKASWRDQLSAADGAQVVFFEGSRQFVMFDMPEEFDQTLADFLEGKRVQGTVHKAKGLERGGPLQEPTPAEMPGGVAPGATDKTKPRLLLPPSPKPGTTP